VYLLYQEQKKQYLATTHRVLKHTDERLYNARTLVITDRYCMRTLTRYSRIKYMDITMHYKIGVTSVYDGHVFYTLF